MSDSLGRAGGDVSKSARSTKADLDELLQHAGQSTRRGDFQFHAISDLRLITQFAGLLLGTPLAGGFGLLLSPVLIIAREVMRAEILGCMVLSFENLKGRAQVAKIEAGQCEFQPDPAGKPVPTVRALYISATGQNRGLAWSMIGDAAEHLGVSVASLAWSFGIEREGCPPEFAPETFSALSQRGISTVLIA